MALTTSHSLRRFSFMPGTFALGDDEASDSDGGLATRKAGTTFDEELLRRLQPRTTLSLVEPAELTHPASDSETEREVELARFSPELAYRKRTRRSSTLDTPSRPPLLPFSAKAQSAPALDQESQWPIMIQPNPMTASAPDALKSKQRLSRDSRGERNASHASSSSMSSSRSDGLFAGPSAAALLADEREANLRTPRPSAMVQGPDGTPQGLSSLSAEGTGQRARVPARNGEGKEQAPESSARWRILQWQRDRNASAEQAAVDAAPSQNVSRQGSVADSVSYPSDSLGHMSITTDGLDASVSEIGDHQRIFSSASNADSQTYNPGSAKKSKRAVAPPEKLVVVRPPPSKQINPLNLQIQLVAPTAASNGARISGESSRDTDASNSTSGSLAPQAPQNNALIRRASSASNRSGSSDTSSTGQSTFSSGSMSRRVTPLYNLVFHSIMATTVTDAGTDQKVAKFTKRGIEIDGFGLIVPQVILNPDHSGHAASIYSAPQRANTGVSGISGGSSGGHLNGSGPHSPDVHSDMAHAQSTDSIHPAMPHGSDSGHEPAGNAEPPTSFDAMSPEAKEPTESTAGLSRLFRGFKKLNISNAPAGSPKNNPLSLRSNATENSQPPSIFSKMSKGKDAESGVSSGRTPGPGNQARLTAEPDSVAQAELPQLVVGAGIRSDGSRRGSGYVWTVRRWTRRVEGASEDSSTDSTPGRHHSGENPILNSVWKRFNMANRMGASETHPPARDIEVRFEWVRQPARKRSSASHGRLGTTPNAKSRGKPRQFSADGQELGGEEGLRPPTSQSRPSSMYSTGGVGGTGSSTRGSMDRSSVADSALSVDDPGVDSDPEDSETLWSCHLRLGPTTRIPIGSMRPTPHHPKLVAQLTIPYPLPDLSQSALGADGAGLTREELKDVISVTSLFVIVREAFGGLAKRRKGDSKMRFGAVTAQR